MVELAHAHQGTTEQTHENQGRVQIFIVLLHELSVILFGFRVVVVEESGPRILLSRW